MRWLHALRARTSLLSRRSAERRMDEEIRFHIDMEADRLAREEGLTRGEARRRALVAFGGVERHKEALRDGRGLARLGGLSLDLRLGLRMLAKYPGLTVVGVVGMAVAVAIGAVAFGFIYTVFDPRTVPLDGGEQVVAIDNIDVRRSAEARWTHLHDLVAWREAVTAVEQFGAFRTADRNLITRDRRPEPVPVAEMTASGFRIARVPPLLGRYFNEEDERPGSPPVVVIGYSVWQGRFAGEPGVIGRTLQLGTTAHTVIGVMPEGFAFPINNRVWTPLNLDPSAFERGDAPAIRVFGRLAPGASLADARTQLATVGRRLAATYPETHRHIQPRILPYTRAFAESPEMAWMSHLIQLMVTMLLVVIGTNVAILVYARTASRTGEIALRSALGASRGRIVGQLFAEALVLSVTAAAVGLGVAWVALGQLNAYIERQSGEQFPFWMEFGISSGMVLYVLGLAVLGAVIVGAVPGLKATRRQLHATLQQGAGGTALRLGRGWTGMIVAQVALAVAALPLAIAGVAVWVRQAMADPAVPPREWMTAAIHLDREACTKRSECADAGAEPERRDPDFEARKANLQTELVRLVRSEPGVVATVLSSSVPGEEPTVRIELEGPSLRSGEAPSATSGQAPSATSGQAPSATSGQAAPAAKPDSAAKAASAGQVAQVARVDAEFFRAFRIPLLAGRWFQAGDVVSLSQGHQPPPDGPPPGLEDVLGGGVVIVNRAFVQQVLGGGDPLGRRVRAVVRQVVRQRDVDVESVRTEPWSEIVGVVPDFPNRVNPRFPEPRIYRPLASGAVNPVTIAVRVRGGAPVEFSARLRELALAADPMLRVQGVAGLDDALHDRVLEIRLMVGVVVAVTLSVLLLSAAGIYALMSFTITRRRREIGIRCALGAGPRGIILGVLSKAMQQIALGIAIGVVIAGFLDDKMDGGFTGGRGVYLLAAVAALMMVVGLIATVGPARRALQIQPTEALKEGG